jgi:hypothetical protein
MDCFKPFRRLLPVGIVSVAGLTGCVSAPAYRPVATSVAPSHPMPSAAASGLGGQTSETVVGDAASSPPPPDSSATPPLPPPPVSAPPVAPPQSTIDSGANGGPALSPPATSGVQPYLSAPMGVLQTPLAPPPAPPATPGETNPSAAPQPPAEGPAPGPPPLSIETSMKIGGAAPQKPVPAKPTEPHLSPLAKLRQRFHSLTHSSAKPAPQKDTAQKSANQATAQLGQPVTGYRVALPTAQVGVVVKSGPGPLHPLYASDEPESAHPIVTNVQVAPVESSPQRPKEIPLTPAEPMPVATKPVGNSEIEQWPYSAGAATSPRPSDATVDSVDASEDFSPISVQEYRETVAKIEPAIVSGTAAEPPAINPTPAQPQSTEPTPVPPNPAASAVIVPGSAKEKSEPLFVIPQAAPRPNRATPSSRVPPESAKGPEVESLRDLAYGPPTPAGWSPEMSSAPAIETALNLSQSEPNPVGANASAGSAFNPGWSLPPAIYQEPRPGAAVVAAPRSYPVTANGRYAQPPWMNSGASPQPTRPAVILRPAVAPAVICRPADAAHGGS